MATWPKLFLRPLMNERKLRSLNANVEANQHADDAGFDMLNKYGLNSATL